MLKKTPIESSKEVLGGTPVFAGTRVPVQTLLDYLEEGRNLDAFFDDFPTVPRSQAVSVLEFLKEKLIGQHDASAA